MELKLAKLDYSIDALSPIMSEETLDLHHGKHHQTYITNLNNFIKDTVMSKMSLEEIIISSSKDKSKAGIFNNASQHWNHIMFWKCMKPNGGGKMPLKLEKKIIEDFGNILNFKKEFIQAGITQFGSGWSWLSVKDGKLIVSKTERLPWRPGEPKVTWANVKKIKKYLGWKPKVSFKDGVNFMLNNIQYWNSAPLWTKKKIKKATTTWFKTLNEKEK